MQDILTTATIIQFPRCHAATITQAAAPRHSVVSELFPEQKINAGMACAIISRGRTYMAERLTEEPSERGVILEAMGELQAHGAVCAALAEMALAIVAPAP